MQIFFATWSSKTFLALSTVILLLVPSFVIHFSLFDAAAACITYSSSSKTITVTCTAPTRLTDVNNVLKNPSILKKESGGIGPGTWLLSANLVVAKGGNFVIDATDTTWLKIRSDGSAAFGLLNYGNLSIKSVKITSWNTATNNYASPGSDGQTPRAYIVAKGGATGKMNIVKCHCAYLGYTGIGHHGLDYYGSDGSVVQDSEIDHNWRAFYSSGVGGLRFDRNIVHDNIEYGVDPHTGTHDMDITNNKVYNNNHGIICSEKCSKIHIENNEIYNNKKDGIFLDAGSTNSIIANNIIRDEDNAITFPSLSNSQIYGNTITNSKYGIRIHQQIGDSRCGGTGCLSVNNYVHHNSIKASSIGIWIYQGASSNIILSNTIDGSNGNRGIVVDGRTTNGNVFNDNHISNAQYPIRVTGGNTNSKFINNHLDTVAASGEFTLSSASALKVENTQFSADVIRSLDSTSNKVSISKSGTISAIDGSTTKKYNTNTLTYAKTLASNAKITVTSSSTSTTSALRTDSTISETNSTSTPSITYDQKNSSASTERSQLGNEKNSNGSKFVEHQSAQQQAKHAQDLAEQQVTNKKEINNEAERTDSSNSIAQKIMEEQNQTPDKVKSNHDNLPADHTTSNKGPGKSESDTMNKGTDHSLSRSLSQYQEQHPKHQTVLTLTLIKEKGGQSYILAGKIWDRTENMPLQGMPISFTADSPIKIVDETTNKEGAFGTNTLSVPSIPGIYKIQGHFAQDKYEPANSNIVTIKVDENQSPDRLLPPNQREVEDKNLLPIDQSEQETSVNATAHEPE